jgi:hypoxanthine phosphoribosyltransferase
MHNPHYSLEDVNYMSYEEFGELTESIFYQVSEYLAEQNKKIDIVVPIVRSGGVLGSMLAVHFKVTTVLPIQFKYSYKPLELKELVPLPDIQTTQLNPVILICEGNTSSGTTAKYTIQEVKNKFPQSTILYATLTAVYNPNNPPIESIDKFFYGIQTNEDNAVDEMKAHELNLRSGKTVFPWEKAEDELKDINDIYEH